MSQTCSSVKVRPARCTRLSSERRSPPDAHSSTSTSSSLRVRARPKRGPGERAGVGHAHRSLSMKASTYLMMHGCGRSRSSWTCAGWGGARCAALGNAGVARGEQRRRTSSRHFWRAAALMWPASKMCMRFTATGTSTSALRVCWPVGTAPRSPFRAYPSAPVLMTFPLYTTLQAPRAASGVLTGTT
jgi:hypothetical protein